MDVLSRLWSVLIWVIAQPHVTSSLSNKAAGLFGQAFLGAKQLTLRASYIFLIRAVYSLGSLCETIIKSKYKENQKKGEGGMHAKRAQNTKSDGCVPCVIYA